MKLNIGCGLDYKEGYINTDVVSRVADELVDLENKLPYPDDSCSEVYARHVLEHINNYDKLIEEVHRVLKPDGRLIAILPYFANGNSYYDDHKRYYNTNSFGRYLMQDQGMFEGRRLFSMESVKLSWGKGFNPLNYVGSLLFSRSFMWKLYENTCLCWLFPATEISFVLVKQ